MNLKDLSSVLGITRERVRQLIEDGTVGKCDDDIDKSGNAWAIGRKTTRKLLESRGIMYKKMTVVIASIKGGIGKTTITSTVAVRAASLGANVLVIDLDPEACATNYLLNEQIDPEAPVFVDIVTKNKSLKSAIVKTKYEGLDLLPSALRNHQVDQITANQNPKKLIKDRLKDVNYDIIFMELPPSWTSATRSAYLAADLIVIPCTPNVFSLESVALTIESVDRLAVEYDCPERNYRVLMNQFSNNKSSSQQILGALISNYGDKVYPVQIKDSADINNAINAGLSIYDARSSKETKNDFNNLTTRICGLGVLDEQSSSA
jgi:chromosome partitioning protein